MKRVVGYVGTCAAAGVAVAVLLSGGAAVADAEVQSSLVEDFAYPGAEAILAEHGLTVLTGDGHIEFESSALIEDDVQCAVDAIQVEADVEGNGDSRFYCFRTSGERGFLTLRIPHTFLLRSGSETVTATAQLPGADKVVTVEAGEMAPIEPGRDPRKLPEAILVELRFGDW